MAFSTGNSQFDFLMSRARNRKRSSDALKNNNINVETSQEKREDSENSKDSRDEKVGNNQVESQIADISGLEASGVSVGTLSPSFTSSINQAQADINAANAIGFSNSGQNAADVAFGRDVATAKADFAQSNPVGAAIAGFSTDAIAQTAVQTAPLGLAMAGQIDAARALANVGNVIGSPAFSLISGIVGPSMKGPMGNTRGMGSGMLGKVASSLMSKQYGIAAEVMKGTPGYGMGNYKGHALGVGPGIFGGLAFTGVTAPDVHVMSPTQFMEAIKSAEQVEDEGAFTGDLDVNEISLENKHGFSANAMSDVALSGGSKDISFNDKGQAFSVNKNGSFTYANGTTTNIKDGKGNPFNAPDTSGTPSGKGSISTTNTQTSGLGSINIDYGLGEDSSNNNNNDDGGTSSGAGDAEGSVGDGYGGGDAYGGRIGKRKKMAMGDVAQKPTTDMGFIGGPPDQFTEQQTIADDIPKEVPEGTFVINAPAVEFAGKEDIKQMLVEAYEMTAQADTDAGTDKTVRAAKIPSKEQVDIMISRGEVVVPPEIAKVIGYDRLEKINNRGKKEVARRQEESQQQEKPQARQVAEGGFIDMQEGGNTEDKFGVNVTEQMNPEFKNKITNLIKAGLSKRSTVEQLIESLPDREALALTIFSESIVSKDSPEAMRAIGETVVNRMNDKTYSFRNLDSIKEVLTGRSRKGEGSKMFGYEGLEPSLLKDRLPEMLNNSYWQKALDAADMALETEPDMEQYKLRDDVFTYAKVGKASNRLKSNKRNEYFTTIGQHDFYSRTPEKGGRISSETMGESPQFYR